MKPSRYNHLRRYPDGLVGVYNTASNAVLFLSETEASRFLSSPYPSNEELFEKGILVSDEVDEVAEILKLEKAASEADFDVRMYTILTTTACNASCPYCYESRWAVKTMDDDTAELAARYILDDSKEGDDLHLWWFGGEPLLNMAPMRTIMRILREDAHRRIASKITTNGSLITEDVADELVDLGISSAQVTIDGLGIRHNAAKSYKTTPPNALEIHSDNPFEGLMHSIDLLLERAIDVQVRANIGANYLEDIPSILAYFEGRYPVNRPSLYFEPIDSLSQKDGVLVSSDDLRDFYARSVDAWASWNRFDDPEDLRYPYLTTHCGACVTYLHKINPDGSLGKCHRDAAYVDDDIRRIRPAGNAKYYDFNHPDECLECAFLPSCHGGCRYKSLYSDYPSAKCCSLRYDIDARLDYAHKLFIAKRQLRACLESSYERS